MLRFTSTIIDIRIKERALRVQRCRDTWLVYKNKLLNLTHCGIQSGIFPTFPQALSCSYACVAINLMLFVVQQKRIGAHTNDRVITDA